MPGRTTWAKWRSNGDGAVGGGKGDNTPVAPEEQRDEIGAGLSRVFPAPEGGSGRGARRGAEVRGSGDPQLRAPPFATFP